MQWMPPMEIKTAWSLGPGDEQKGHDLLKEHKNGNVNDKVDDTKEVEDSVGTSNKIQ